jgi:hypothetical protein
MNIVKGKRKNHRVYPGAKHRPDLAQTRKDEAKERQAAYDNLSAQEKLNVLDGRLGKGVGATRQREKLNALLGRQEKEVVVEA